MGDSFSGSRLVPGESARWWPEAIHRFKVEPRFVGSRLRRCYSGFQFSPFPHCRGSRSFQLGSPHPPATQPITPGTCSALPLSCSSCLALSRSSFSLLSSSAFIYSSLSRALESRAAARLQPWILLLRGTKRNRWREKEGKREWGRHRAREAARQKRKGDVRREKNRSMHARA